MLIGVFNEFSNLFLHAHSYYYISSFTGNHQFHCDLLSLFFCHKENYLQDSFLWDTLGPFWRNIKNLTKPLKKYIVVSKLPNKSKSWTYGSNKSQIFGIVNDQLQSRYLNRFISSSTLPNFTSNVAAFWKRSAESWKCDWRNG